MNKHSNPCYRCGKERIFVRTWKDKVGNSVVTTTESACPDSECQKMVEKENKKQIDRYNAAKTRRKNFSGNRKSKRS